MTTGGYFQHEKSRLFCKRTWNAVSPSRLGRFGCVAWAGLEVVGAAGLPSGVRVAASDMHEGRVSSLPALIFSKKVRHFPYFVLKGV